MVQRFATVIILELMQWRINHEAMEARASGPQFLGQKIGPALVLICF